MNTPQSSRFAHDSVAASAWSFVVYPTVTMSLGWGLRGTIGGGPMGAMIPGAMLALCLCRLLGRTSSVAEIAAWGAIGFGLGGQMTYGQTIGFIRVADTFGWGLLGLTVKGTVWGFSGGALLAAGLLHRRFERRDLWIAIFLLLAGTYVGWALINRTQFIYFSNPLHEPRPEVWAGILLGAILFTGFLASRGCGRVLSAFAIVGAIAGGVGFGGGGLLMRLGEVVSDPYRGWPWWKLMEFSFGAMLGLGMGLAAYVFRDELLEPDAEPEVDPWRPASPFARVLIGSLLVIVALTFNFTTGHPFQYSILGAALLLAALDSSYLAWQAAVGLTTLGFVRDLVIDFAKRHSANPMPTAIVVTTWVTVILTGLLIAAHIERRDRVERLDILRVFRWLTVSAVVVALVKVGGHQLGSPLNPRLAFVEAVFVAMTVIVYWLPASEQAGQKSRRAT